MTPIQKAKEIIKGFFNNSFRPPWGKDEDSSFDKWIQTKEAAALLSGEDWKEDDMRLTNRLRRITGYGITDCKRALEELEDRYLDLCIDYIRKNASKLS